MKDMIFIFSGAASAVPVFSIYFNIFILLVKYFLKTIDSLSLY